MDWPPSPKTSLKALTPFSVSVSVSACLLLFIQYLYWLDRVLHFCTRDWLGALHLLLNSTWKGFNLINESLQVVLLLQSEHRYLMMNPLFSTYSRGKSREYQNPRITREFSFSDNLIVIIFCNKILQVNSKNKEELTLYFCSHKSISFKKKCLILKAKSADNWGEYSLNIKTW